MGISDFIQRKKAEFFVARDGDKLQQQKVMLQQERERLSKERQDVESIRKIQDDIRQDRQKIHEARTQGSRDFAGKIGKGFKALQQNMKKIEKHSSGGNPDSPFYTGGVMGTPAPKKKEPQGKTIHIHLKQ